MSREYQEEYFEYDCCPICGSERFVTEPNQYDVLSFEDRNFDIVRSESIGDYFEVFCQQCDAAIDFNGSIDEGRIILKTDE